MRPWESDKLKFPSGHVSVAKGIVRRRMGNILPVLESAPIVPGTNLSTLHVLMHPVLPTSPLGRFCCHFYCINEATEAQRGCFTQGCTARKWQGWGLPRRCDPGTHFLVVTGLKWKLVGASWLCDAAQVKILLLVLQIASIRHQTLSPTRMLLIYPAIT